MFFAQVRNCNTSQKKLGVIKFWHGFVWKNKCFCIFGWNSASFLLGRSVSFVHVLVLLGYLSTCLSTVSISPAIHLFNLSNYASIYLSNLSITRSIRLSIDSSLYLFICPFIYVPMYLFIHVSCLFVHSSLCILLPIHHIDLSICLSSYLFIYLSSVLLYIEKLIHPSSI